MPQPVGARSDGPQTSTNKGGPIDDCQEEDPKHHTREEARRQQEARTQAVRDPKGCDEEDCREEGGEEEGSLEEVRQKEDRNEEAGRGEASRREERWFAEPRGSAARPRQVLRRRPPALGEAIPGSDERIGWAEVFVGGLAAAALVSPRPRGATP